jgi:MFS family permease
MLPLFHYVLSNFFLNALQISDVLRITEPQTIGNPILFVLFPFLGGNTSSDLIVVLLLVPLATIILAVFAKPLANLMVRLHSLIKLGKYGYRVEKIGEQFGLGDFLNRAVYPSLFCFTLGLAYAQDIIAKISRPDFIEILSAMPLAFVFGLLMVPIAALLWGPIWVLEDSGITAFLKPEQRERRQTPDTEGVGRYYRIYLNGFVGVSTFIGLGTYLYNSILIQLNVATRFQAILGLVVMLLIPFYAILAFSPLLLVHERFFKNHRQKLTESLVKQKVVPPLEEEPTTSEKESFDEKPEPPPEDDGFLMS